MLIHKCDICKKTIKEYTDQIRVGLDGLFTNIVLCKKCAEPITKFLKKHRLTKEKINKQ